MAALPMESPFALNAACLALDESRSLWSGGPGAKDARPPSLPAADDAEDIFRQARRCSTRSGSGDAWADGPQEAEHFAGSPPAATQLPQSGTRFPGCSGAHTSAPRTDGSGNANADGTVRSGNPTLLDRWRKAARRGMICNEMILVKEEDFHRFGGDLELLRKHQVPPFENLPRRLSFKEAFEQSCREQVSPRDPWRGLPNPELSRPAYESDLILNQVIPLQSPRRCVQETDRPVPRTPRATWHARRVDVASMGSSPDGPTSASSASRAGRRGASQSLMRRRTVVLSSPELPQIRPKTRNMASW